MSTRRPAPGGPRPTRVRPFRGLHHGYLLPHLFAQEPAEAPAEDDENFQPCGPFQAGPCAESPLDAEAFGEAFVGAICGEDGA